ncbi:WxL domain-containing protein [Enterococcus faecium]|nr:WxL domain-containing protein [Enterococcus faecium]
MKKHVTLFSSVLMMSTTLLGAGGVFAEEANPKDAQTSVSATLTVDTSEKPTLPGGTTDTDHTDNNTTAAFGIAYQPKTLTGSKKLNASGKQEIELTNNTTTSGYHVGVKDLTREQHEWNLTAKLSWTGENSKYMDGSEIKLAGGVVKQNNSGTLNALTNEEVTGNSEVTISSSPSAVMTSNKSKTQNGVYDYGFTSANLSIPSVEKVPSGTYAGTIDWNLSLVPGE